MKKITKLLLVISVFFACLLLTNDNNSYAIYRDSLNTKVYLSVLDPTATYEVIYETYGGSAVSQNPQYVLRNHEIGPLPTTTKPGYNFIGWWTEKDGGTKIEPYTVVSGDVTYHAHWAKIVCKKAVSGTLHTETCESGGGCLKHGYTTSGDNHVITYGTIPGEYYPIPGDAYDCDVNNDGTYSSTTERFYFIRKMTDGGVENGALVHYTSFDENGQMDSSKTRNNYTYDAGKAYLPDSTLWSNPALLSFDGKVSRYIYHDDFKAACGNPVVYNSSAYLSTCQYFMENSRYQSGNLGRAGIWAEKLNDKIYRIQTQTLELQQPSDTASANTVRPVIEIPYNTIEGYVERTSYRVKFNTLGGTAVESINRYENEVMGLLPTTRKAGFNFEGWFTDNGTFENRVTENTVVTDSMTLYAKWNEIIDNLDYVFYIPGQCTFNGSSIDITSSTNDCISTVNPTGSNIDYTATSNKYINTGVSLYSHDNIDKDYEIGFTIVSYVPNANMAQATLMNTKNESTGYPGLVFRKRDNNFELASRKTSEANEMYIINDPSTVQNVKIYRTSGSIYYSINDGEKTLLNDLTQYNPEFDLTTWFGAAPKNATGTTAQRYLTATLSNMYIRLESDTVVQNTVTFHAEDGTTDYYEKEVKRGSAIGSLPNATKSGYYFAGWYTAPNGGGTKVTESTIITQDIDLYAHWKDIYLVTFNGEGGTVSINPNTIEIVEGETIGANNLPTATKTGYRFVGWYTDLNDPTTKVDGTEPITIDVTYHAQYKATHLVTFNGEGGTVNITPNPIEVIDGESIGELPTATFAGFSFEGWYTDLSDPTTKVDGTESITQDTEYHAKYTSACRVTFDGNGGTPYFSTKDLVYGSAIGELPTAEHNTDISQELEGWYTDLNDPTTKADETQTIITSDVTYHAKWVTTSKVAMVGTTKYETLSLAVEAVPTNGIKTTVTMLNNTAENVTVNGGRNVYLDLNGKTVSHPSSGAAAQVFTVTSATLELTNGTVTSSKGSGMINVNAGGTLRVGTDAVLSATGTRQAIYIDGGTTYILDGATISGNATERAVIHNKTNGTLVITGGTITSSNLYAIYNESGSLTIGTKDGIVDTTTPIIEGKTYGIAANSTYKFYDGIIKGKTAAVGKTSNTGNTPTVSVDTEETKISEYEDGTEKVTEQSGDYNVLYLQYETNNYRVTLETRGGTLTPPISVISVVPGNHIGTIPTPTKGAYTFDGWFDKDTDEEVDENTIPEGNMTIYAKWSFTPSHQTFNLINDPMRVYYNNLSTWKSNESTFQTNMDTNFNNYNCLECDGQASKPYQNCPATGENQCDRPRGFTTGVTGTINVYNAVQSGTTYIKGTAVNYVTVTSSGVIYDMIPGQTYYWELDSDNNIYGTVTVTGERRILEAGGVRNIRDLGGFEVDIDGNGTVDGVVDYGRMFRGPKLNSSADVASLQKLGITEEIDLRGSQNESKLSNYVGREIVNYEIDPEHYSTNYTNLRNALTATMNDIINDENVYFHCAIGTDRTGTLAWFLEGLLGVSEEDRVEDYELSYFYGLLNRHRFYSTQPGSSITHRFVYMYNLYPTNTDIYNYYTINGTDAAAVARVQAFRDAIITYNNQP